VTISDAPSVGGAIVARAFGQRMAQHVKPKAG
jgi:hypothetical protein